VSADVPSFTADERFETTAERYEHVAMSSCVASAWLIGAATPVRSGDEIVVSASAQSSRDAV
jgi:hypothetical protein